MTRLRIRGWTVIAALAAPAFAQPTVVFDRVFDASRHENFVAVPVSTWPTHEGDLVIRVAATQGVHGCHQLVCGDRREPLVPKDYRVDADVIEKTAHQLHRPPSWAWWAEGHGKMRVQVLYFSTKQEAKRFMETYPHATHFAPTAFVVAEPEVPRVIWEGDFVAAPQPSFQIGPGCSWDPNRGAVLLRAIGTQGVRAIVWRLGQDGAPQELSPGDHLFEPNVLARPSSGNPLEAIFGGGQTAPLAFHFGAVGTGAARIQVCWLPDRGMASEYCQRTPFAFPSAAPPVAAPPGPPLPGPGGPPPGTYPAGGGGPPPETKPGTQPPAPPAATYDPRTAPGFVTIQFFGTLSDLRTRGAMPDVDVIVQLADGARTTFGGGRTDAYGRYFFSATVPANATLVLRVPERRGDSPPKAFNPTESRHEWNAAF